MPGSKSSFLDKVLGRIGRLDAQGLQTVVQRFARERSFLENLFDAIEDGILVLDENGRAIYFNEAVTRLLGLQPGAAEGKFISEFLPQFNWASCAELNAQAGPKVMRQEFEISFPRERFLHVYATPLDGERSGSSGVALILHDATEARQKTFEAIESERIQALTLLAASVAHEIGNPLNALHIHLQLMEREAKRLKKLGENSGALRLSSARTRLAQVADETRAISERFDHYLSVAKGEISRLDYIVTQFLQAIRPRPPQMVLASLNAVVDETVELLRPEIENRGQRLELKKAKDLGLAHFDPGQIKQVLVNLMKNAMQAMSRGGVLTLATGGNSEGVWLSVTDNGCGIPQEQINRIFEPFFTTKKKGSGLGLMIVQRIIREHGGRIDLQSHPGRGTTFGIWLPLQERSPRLLGSAVTEQIH